MVQTAIIKQDLLYPSVSPVVYAVQGDNFTRAIQILLFSGGQPITISEDCSAIIGYRKPDGTSGAYDSFSDESGTTPAYDISGNSVRFFLAPEMLSEPGDVFITVKITNEEKSLHSFELILRVQKNHGLEPQSENYFKIAGTVADSGWSPNEYLGTDENGKVVAKKIDGIFVKTVNGIAPDENGNVNVDGVSAEEKELILSLFRNAAYTADMSATFAQLSELWGIEAPEEPDVPDEPEEPDVPVVTLTSISATYSGGDVPVGTAVTDLTGIVVTAHYSDGTSKAVTDYTLSGTIAEGANTITVSYGGKSTTFAVTGVAEEEPVYQLAEETTFDGTTIIDTGYAMYGGEPQDHTIVLTLSGNANSPYGSKIFKCGNNTDYLELSLYGGTGGYSLRCSQGAYSAWCAGNESIEAKLVIIKTSSNNEPYTAYRWRPSTSEMVSTTAGRGASYYPQNITNTLKFGEDGFIGTIHDFKVYDRVFTEDEIKEYLGVSA